MSKYELMETTGNYIDIDDEDGGYEILSADEIKTLSLTQYQRERDLLAEKRKAITLKLDGRKLQQANRIIDIMETTLTKISECLIDGTAMDFNFLVQGYERLSKQLSTLVRLDSVDGSGKSARLALQVNFGSGTTVKAVVEEQ